MGEGILLTNVEDIFSFGTIWDDKNITNVEDIFSFGTIWDDKNIRAYFNN